MVQWYQKGMIISGKSWLFIKAVSSTRNFVHVIVCKCKKLKYKRYYSNIIHILLVKRDKQLTLNRNIKISNQNKLNYFLCCMTSFNYQTLLLHVYNITSHANLLCFIYLQSCTFGCVVLLFLTVVSVLSFLFYVLFW